MPHFAVNCSGCGRVAKEKNRVNKHAKDNGVMKKKALTAVITAIVLMTAGAATAQNKVEITVTNVPDDNGNVLVSTADGHAGMAQAKKGEVTVTVDNVPDGNTTFYILHDANGNMTCDMDGEMPKEHVGQCTFYVSKDNTKCTAGLEYIPEKVKKEKEKK